LLVLVDICSVFLLFWFSCQYLPSDWLERRTPLRKPNLGEVIVSTQSLGRRVFMIFLVYCTISLFYDVSVLSLSPTLYISYSYGTMEPICAESAVKRQQTKPNLFGSIGLHVGLLLNSRLTCKMPSVDR